VKRAAVIFAALVALVALQVAYPVGIVAWNEIQLARGYEVRLQTVPVDPRDLFRGDYVVLRYEITTVQPDFEPPRKGDTVYVSLRKVGPRYTARGMSTEKPDGMPFIRGRVVSFDDEQYRGEVDYGIERYYIPEGTGRDYERAKFLYVDVELDRNGKARIRDVIIPRGANEARTG
jgi:uncharacterized membrane-anchored protein